MGVNSYNALELRSGCGQPGMRLKMITVEIGQQGWADAPEQTLIGVNAIAAPVFSKTDDLAGMITVVGSVQSLKPKVDKSLLNSLLAAAGQISSRLGYMPRLKS